MYRRTWVKHVAVSGGSVLLAGWLGEASASEDEAGGREDDEESTTGEEGEEEVDPRDVPPHESLEELNCLVVLEHDLVEPDEFRSHEVQGVVENQRDEEVDHVEVAVRVYDEDGEQRGTYVDSTNDLQPDDTWSFRVMLFRDHENMASYDVRIADSPI